MKGQNSNRLLFSSSLILVRDLCPFSFQLCVCVCVFKKSQATPWIYRGLAERNNGVRTENVDLFFKEHLKEKKCQNQIFNVMDQTLGEAEIKTGQSCLDFLTSILTSPRDGGM